MSPSLAILLAVASLCTIHATPLALISRSPRIIVENDFGSSASGVSFDPNSASCPSDVGGWGVITADSTADFTGAVNVRPDCDNVINSICNVVNMWHATNAARGSLGSLYHTDHSCEGHFVVKTVDHKGRIYGNTVDYRTCVAQFQSIALRCMVVGESDAAVAGAQYGAVNARYLRSSGWQKGNDNPENQNTDPGYLMGPPGIFKGLQDSTDSSTITVTTPA